MNSREQWGEDLEDYAAALGYLSVQEMLYNMKEAVRIEQRAEGLWVCAVAGPKVQHNFALIDKTR